LLLLYDPEDGFGEFLRNVGELLPDYTVPHPKILVLFMVMAAMA
jgi:hypothetical protein